MTTFDSATPKKLRNIAWALDHLSRFAIRLIEPVARGHAMNAETVEVTVEVTLRDEPLSREQAETFLEWISGTGMQDDLRAWADELERDHDCSPHCEWPDCPGYPGLYLLEPDGHPLADGEHERFPVPDHDGDDQ